MISMSIQVTAALVKVEQQQEVYVPLRPICEYLGLSGIGQRERIGRDEVLRDALKGVGVTRTPSVNNKRAVGGPQETLSLPLKYLPGWLLGNYVDTCIRTNVVLLWSRTNVQKAGVVCKYTMLKAIRT